MIPPTLHSCSSVRQVLRAIYDQNGCAMYTYIPPILEKRKQALDKENVVFWRIGLLDKNFMLGRIPAPRPVFVGPAKAEVYVGVGVYKKIVQRSLQQSLTCEPIVVKA